MRWYKDLYVGYNLLERQKEVVEKIKYGKIQFNVYAITLPQNDYDILEIYPAWVLIQNHYKKSDMMVVGICYGREESLDMIKLIIDDCMANTGGIDVGKYIMETAKEYENKGK